jgi:hypothetical protein
MVCPLRAYGRRPASFLWSAPRWVAPGCQVRQAAVLRPASGVGRVDASRQPRSVYKSPRRCAATPFVKVGDELPPLKKGAANAVSGGFFAVADEHVQPIAPTEVAGPSTSRLEVWKLLLMSQVPSPQSRARGSWHVAGGSDHVPPAIRHVREARPHAGWSEARLASSRSASVTLSRIPHRATRSCAVIHTSSLRCCAKRLRRSPFRHWPGHWIDILFAPSSSAMNR